MDRKRGLSERLLLGDWMPLTYGISEKILQIPYTQHVTITSVRETTGCPPVSSIIKTRRLCFVVHIACSDSRQDHHRAVRASLGPPRDWRRPRGRPRTTWLTGIDADVQSANIGIHSAWRKVNDHVLWRHIINTTTLQHGLADALTTCLRFPTVYFISGIAVFVLKRDVKQLTTCNSHCLLK